MNLKSSATWGKAWGTYVKSFKHFEPHIFVNGLMESSCKLFVHVRSKTMVFQNLDNATMETGVFRRNISERLFHFAHGSDMIPRYTLMSFHVSRFFLFFCAENHLASYLSESIHITSSLWTVASRNYCVTSRKYYANITKIS